MGVLVLMRVCECVSVVKGVSGVWVYVGVVCCEMRCRGVCCEV